MKKTIDSKKLSLTAETVRALDHRDLVRPAGGLRALPDETEQSYCELKCLSDGPPCGNETTTCP